VRILSCCFQALIQVGGYFESPNDVWNVNMRQIPFCWVSLVVVVDILTCFLMDPSLASDQPETAEDDSQSWSRLGSNAHLE
jgi:hypothetical protein